MTKSIALLKSYAAKKGGLEKSTHRIQQAFIEKGWKVFLLTTGKDLSSTVFSLPKGPNFRKIESFDRACNHWVQTHKPDVVLSMDRNRFPTHIRAGNGCHRAYLTTRFLTEGFWKKWSCQINPLHRTILQMEKDSFENPNLKALITNSHMVREEILEHYTVDPNKIFVIHNGVEHKALQSTFDQWQTIKQQKIAQLGLDPSHYHFLFVGNGFARKGLKPFMEALAMLSRKDVVLSVVGKDKSMKAFQGLAKKLHIENQVKFWGEQDAHAFYAMADALAIPSYYDPFANVTVEALAMGLFVISSKSNGGHEILQGQGDIIENLFSLDSICSSIKKALNSPKTIERAKNIRKSIEHLDFSYQMQTFVQTVLQTS